MNDRSKDPQPAPETAVQSLLAQAREGLHGKVSIGEAMTACRKAISLLEATQLSSTELPAALVVLGQLHEGQGTAPGLNEAVTHYDRALAWWKERSEAEPRDTGEWARTWMNRGNALQKYEDPAAWTESVASYEQAIRLLEQDPSNEETQLTAGAAWMNLGVVRQKQGGPESVKEAVKAHSKAVEFFRALPLSEDVHFRRSLGAAFLNEGVSRLTLGGADQDAKGLALSQEVLGLVENDENNDFLAADLGLRARRLFCEAKGKALQGEKQWEKRVALASAATDVAEDALRKLCVWEQRSVTQFRSYEVWFFHFGAAMYADYQPQFLAEYLADWTHSNALPPAFANSPVVKKISAELLGRARARISEELFKGIGSEKAAKLAEVLESLQRAETRGRESSPGAA